MPMLWVTHDEADRFTACVRDHELAIDQPIADGGDDTGLSPVEMFVTSLAACVAHYARRYLRLHHLAEDPLAVSARWTIANNPPRITAVQLDITIPDDVPAERRPALLAVAKRCTLHNTLRAVLDIDISLADVSSPAA